MVYTTTTLVYNGTPLTESDVDATKLQVFINDATVELNKHINSFVIRERVLPIDSVRENLIDGSNRTYYVSKCKSGVYFGDTNNDGTVTVSDIAVFVVDGDDNETEVTVSSIDNDDMSFTLESAPASNTQAIYVTYTYSYFDVTIPDKLIEMAARYLSAHYAFVDSENGLGGNVKIGNISVSGLDKKSNSISMLRRYEEILLRILTFGNTRNLPVRHIRI